MQNLQSLKILHSTILYDLLFTLNQVQELNEKLTNEQESRQQLVIITDTVCVCLNDLLIL